MKTFIGTKIVKSIPMTRLEYNSYRGWGLPSNENGADEGYLVEYTDGGLGNHPDHTGYISWSPKKQFDDAHTEIPDAQGLAPHQVRVAGEKAELDSKLKKLGMFFHSSIFAGLSMDGRDRLRKQAILMAAYSEILGDRIAAF